MPTFCGILVLCSRDYFGRIKSRISFYELLQAILERHGIHKVIS